MRYFFIIIFIISPNCLASEAEAISVATRAIIKTETATNLRRKYTKSIMAVIPEEYKQEIAIGAASLYSVTRGEISTKPIRNFNMELFEGVVTSSVIYNFRNNILDARVQIDWEF